MSRQALAAGGLLALVLLALSLLRARPVDPQRSAPAGPSPAQAPLLPTPSPSLAQPTASRVSAPSPLRLPAPGLSGANPAGTLFVQLELRADSARLLHIEARPELPFRLRPSAGRYGLLLEGPQGASASLRFEVQGLAPSGQDEVTGDELRLAAAPILLKLPRLGSPARLRVVSPAGTILGDLQLEE